MGGGGGGGGGNWGVEDFKNSIFHKFPPPPPSDLGKF